MRNGHAGGVSDVGEITGLFSHPIHYIRSTETYVAEYPQFRYLFIIITMNIIILHFLKDRRFLFQIKIINNVFMFILGKYRKTDVTLYC